MLEPELAMFGLSVPAHLAREVMHLDPDFEFLTYGDRVAKGRQLESSLRRGDLIVFYAGLRPLNGANELLYAIIGVLTVERIENARERPKSEWHRNAHTRRELPLDADDVIVVGAREGSGRLARAIPIGTYRAGAYRVTEMLRQAWGGLSARDGYLQRSAVSPRCLSPHRFLRWWSRQRAELIVENNPAVRA